MRMYIASIIIIMSLLNFVCTYIAHVHTHIIIALNRFPYLMVVFVGVS